ncbi:uncharacterized protein MONOS_158 [Monocercomonoides exilis]|uniref:uncharacterized protein n=1 Tax=Monocercomonoides exilis TaxID=2049356 RepID=UPI003559400B|nr:hypothetical protein MONOS_158 [Monocercomonoides exilis]|eukprot:MONOS_158.1-p1 / transcript=MONOS_158.1 / gene=MONOS_158 / organism=Monocercomonoides_exilis_PA203 / gene_product=unspecified product / transcript_product=unspecified product / location=Mono_scaffold00003:55103-58078(+) / protein_length=782 / sequence_SO=supercontig / SO=protein_coding / is_pseudo=false
MANVLQYKNVEFNIKSPIYYTAKDENKSQNSFKSDYAKEQSKVVSESNSRLSVIRNCLVGYSIRKSKQHEIYRDSSFITKPSFHLTQLPMKCYKGIESKRITCCSFFHYSAKHSIEPSYLLTGGDEIKLWSIFHNNCLTAKNYQTKTPTGCTCLQWQHQPLKSSGLFVDPSESHLFAAGFGDGTISLYSSSSSCPILNIPLSMQSPPLSTFCASADSLSLQSYPSSERIVPLSSVMFHPIIRSLLFAVDCSGRWGMWEIERKERIACSSLTEGNFSSTPHSPKAMSTTSFLSPQCSSNAYSPFSNAIKPFHSVASSSYSRSLAGAEWAPHPLAFHTDGSLMAVGDNTTIRLIDLRTGKETSTLKNYSSSPINSASFCDSAFQSTPATSRQTKSEYSTIFDAGSPEKDMKTLRSSSGVLPSSVSNCLPSSSFHNSFYSLAASSSKALYLFDLRMTEPLAFVNSSSLAALHHSSQMSPISGCTWMPSYDCLVSASGSDVTMWNGNLTYLTSTRSPIDTFTSSSLPSSYFSNTRSSSGLFESQSLEQNELFTKFSSPLSSSSSLFQYSSSPLFYSSSLSTSFRNPHHITQPSITSTTISTHPSFDSDGYLPFHTNQTITHQQNFRPQSIPFGYRLDVSSDAEFIAVIDDDGNLCVFSTNDSQHSTSTDANFQGVRLLEDREIRKHNIPFDSKREKMVFIDMAWGGKKAMKICDYLDEDDDDNDQEEENEDDDEIDENEVEGKSESASEGKYVDFYTKPIAPFEPFLIESSGCDRRMKMRMDDEC